jgi:hypothetical protein
MDEFDIELVEGVDGDPFEILGDASETNLIADALSDLAKGVGSSVAAKQAAAAAAKPGAVPGKPPGIAPGKPGAPSAFSKHYAGLPLYGWLLVGGLVVGFAVVGTELFDKKKGGK